MTIKNFTICLSLICVSQALFAQKVQISTNAADWMAFATINAGVEYALDQHWSVGVSGRYNPFSYNEEREQGPLQLKQRSVSAQARWWPWHVYSGWWVSPKVQWQEYNWGGIVSPQTEEGQRYGGGLSAGYSYMLAKHWNVDFGLGLWGGVKKYTVYTCPRCGSKTDGGIKGFVLPSDLVLAFSYVF